MTTKHRITVNLEEGEYEALQRIAEDSERSLAWLGRRAICDFIDQRERADFPLLGRADASIQSQRGSAQ